MPFGFDFPQIRRPNAATPPFVPQGAVPALSSPEEDEELTPSSAASKELQELLAARQQEKLQHPTSLKRQIIGGIVGGWAPGIGQAIADPGEQRFRQQAELLKQKAQLEDAALDRRYKIENIQSGIANRQELRRQAQQKLDDAAAARQATDMVNRDKMGQMVINPEYMKFESAGVAMQPPAQQYGPPTQAAARDWTPTPPAPQYGPPAPPPLASPEGPSYRGVADLPLQSGMGSGPRASLTAAVRPEGTYQVSSTEYDPKGSLRVQKTPGQIAKEKWESTTIETPADIMQAFPGSAARMTENAILGFRNAMIRQDTAAAAALAAKERANEANALKLELQENSNNLRRELAGQSANLQRELAAKKNSDKPATGAERQTRAYYGRAKGSVDDISAPWQKTGKSLEQIAAESGTLEQGKVKVSPNWMNSKEQQAYLQAQRAFTEARLRKESGAAIPEHEFENDAQRYFVQPGDYPETIEQKRIARERVLDGLASASGRAYDEYYGAPYETPAVRARGANTAAPATPSSGAARTAQGGYEIGAKYGGLTYLGGDPKDEKNWKK